MLVLGHMLMCRLVDDRLATEERRLAGPQDRQEDQTDQDQPETQDRDSHGAEYRRQGIAVSSGAHTPFERVVGRRLR